MLTSSHPTMLKFPGVLVLLAGILLGGAGGYLVAAYLYTSDTPADTPQTTEPAEVTIGALGRIQPKNGLITIYGPSGDRIDEILVQQHVQVSAGAGLIRLASHQDAKLHHQLVVRQREEAQKQLQSIKTAADAKLEQIDLQLQQVDATRADDLDALDAQIKAHQAHVDQLDKNLKRLQGLQRYPVSRQELESIELQLRKAQAELRAARANQRKTRTVYKNKKSVLQAQRRAALAEKKLNLEQVPLGTLQQQEKIARKKLADTTLKARVAGQVLQIPCHEGQVTMQEPLLFMADTREMIVIAEVDETDLRHLRNWKNVVAKMTSPALGNRTLHGTVNQNHIPPLIAKNKVLPLDPRAEVDRRVVEVRINLDKESSRIAAGFIRMQVTVQLREGTGS